jgi:hypothetical protein
VLLELLSLCEQLVVQLALLVVQLAQQLLVQRQVLQVQAQRVLPQSSKYSVELQALELGESHLWALLQPVR